MLGGTLQNVGIYDREISDLSEIEKRLVIILTLQQQMARSAAMGDLARTIEQPANQLKILQQQIAEVGRWLSAVFYGVISQILPYINGFVMAIKSLIQMFATFVGYELPDSSGDTGTILDDVSDSMDDINSGIDDANSGLDSAKQKTKEWKNFLAGFDVANVIPDQDSEDTSGSGSSGSGSGVSVDPRLLQALEDMDYIFGKVHMKAMDIRDRLLEWADILGKIIDDNIFKPIQNSWNKYGAGIISNIKETRDDIVYVLGGVFEVIGEKWKPFFQSASDLFFSLSETATLVTDNITTFLRHVWDKGGKYLFEALWDLATAFLDLATSVNDNFVKPMLTWFNKNISPAFGDLVGIILKGAGKIVKGFANVISWISKCKPVVITLSSAFAAMFLTIKIGKLLQLISSVKETIEIYGGLKDMIKTVIKKFIENNTAVSGAKSAIATLNTVISNTGVWTAISNKINLVAGKFSLAGTMSGGLAGTLKTKLGSALTWLANNPIVAVIAGITAVIAIIAALGNKMKEKKYDVDDYSDSVREQKEAVDELKSSLDSAKKSYEDSLVDAQAEAEELQRTYENLKKLGGKTGIIDKSDLTEATRLQGIMNEKLGDCVKITEEGKLVWQQNKEQIDQNIESLRKKAEEEAKAALYSEYIKANIKAMNEQKVAQDQLATKQKELEELESKWYLNRTKSENDRIDQLKADISGLKDTVEVAGQTIDESNAYIKEYEENLYGAADSVAELTDEMASFYESFGLSDKAGTEFENLANQMEKTTNTMNNCMKDGKVINQKEYEDVKKTRQKLVGEYAEKAKKYKLSYNDIINIAKKNGVKLTNEEKKQLKESLDNAKKSKSDLQKVKEEQNKELLTLLEKHGIDKNSKLGQQYQAELRKAQEKGTESGDAYIKNIKKSIDQQDISPNVKAQWDLGQNIFKNPLTTSTKVTGAESAGQSAYDTLKKLIVKTYNGTVKTTGASEAGSKAATDIKEKVKNLPASLNKTVGNVSNAWTYVKDWFNGKSVSIKVDLVAGKVTSTVQNALKLISGFMYADGGFPDVGQVFIAREAGPEMVGTIGGHTAVANNDQIVSGITSGVYQAVLQALRDGGNVQKRGGDLYITIQNSDGTTTEKVIRDYEKQMIFSGGKGGFKI